MPYSGYTDARKKANARYEEKVSSLRIRTSDEHKRTIEEAAAKAGQSINVYVLQAIDERMEREK